jgi:hypothetical protein
VSHGGVIGSNATSIGISVADLVRKCWVSDAIVYSWKVKRGDMDVSDAILLKIA